MFCALGRVLADTVVRWLELCGLRWRDVDLVLGWAEIRRTRVSIGYKLVVDSKPKTDSGFRWIAIDDSTTSVLKTRRRTLTKRRLQIGSWPDHDLVFTTSGGHPLHPDLVSDRSRRLAKPAGLPPLSQGCGTPRGA